MKRSNEKTDTSQWVTNGDISAATKSRRGLRQSPGGQEGYILLIVIIVMMLGTFMLLPLLGLLSTASRAIIKDQDNTRYYYAASAGIEATMTDLVQGIDASPDPPYTYTPPVVSINDVAPAVDIGVIESPVLSKTHQRISYVAGEPTILEGSLAAGNGDYLDVDDTSYYSVLSTGTPSSLTWEATSGAMSFDTINFVTVTFIGQNDRGYVRVEFYVYNPDDPEHTQGGYSVTPDATVNLEERLVEYLTFFYLPEADVDYVNSLETKTVKLKVRAWRSLGDFKLQTDQLIFEIAGVTAIYTKEVAANPTILLGTYVSGNKDSLDVDDVNYYKVGSAGTTPTIAWEATSEVYGFTDVDDVSVDWVGQTDRADITQEFYVYNPADPAHTQGGYDTVPDHTIVYSAKFVDKSANIQLSAADVAYISSLSDMVVRVKVQAYGAPGSLKFDLNGDLLTFTATSASAPMQIIGLPKQQYFDPGVTNPDLANVPSRQGYLVRFHDVKAGLWSVNWAYTPAAATTLRVFRGFPVNGQGEIIPPGRITENPPVSGNDLVVQSQSPQNATSVQTLPKMLDAGVYTIVFWNESNDLLTTGSFHKSADYSDTWVWGVAYRDYLITAEAGGVVVQAVVRAAPGRSEPPEPPWDRDNVSWVSSELTYMSWEPPAVP